MTTTLANAGTRTHATGIATALAVSLVLTLIGSGPGAAQPNLVTASETDTEGTFFRRKEEGYYWYDDPKPEPEPQIVEILPPPPPPPEPVTEPPKPTPEPTPAAAPAPPPGPPIFSVKWLQQQLPEMRQVAIDDPTEENVAAYMYAQRVMMDKADVFASVWQDVLRKDPLLDENNRFPMSEAFKLFQLRSQDQARRAALTSLNQKAGLFYFFHADCEFCHAQLPLLYTFAKEHEFSVRLVALDGKPLAGMQEGDYLVDTGQAKAMKISVVPAIVLAVPPNDIFIITQGYIDYEALMNRVYLAAEDMNLVDPDLLVKANPMERGVLPPDVLKEAQARGIGQDPSSMVGFLREKMHEALYGSDVPVQAPRTARNLLPDPTPDPALDFLYPPVEPVRTLSQPLYQPTPIPQEPVSESTDESTDDEASVGQMPLSLSLDGS